MSLFVRVVISTGKALKIACTAVAGLMGLHSAQFGPSAEHELSKLRIAVFRLCWVALTLIPMSAAAAAPEYRWGGTVYPSMQSAEAAMRRFNIDRGGNDLYLCKTETNSPSNTIYTFCVDYKPASYTGMGGYWIGLYGFNCENTAVPLPGAAIQHQCWGNSEGEVVAKFNAWFQEEYAGYCNLETGVSGSYVEPLSYWGSEQQLYENGLLKYFYTVEYHNDASNFREIAYRWRRCEDPPGSPLHENRTRIHLNYAHACPAGYRVRNMPELAVADWPYVCRAFPSEPWITKNDQPSNTCRTPNTGQPCVPATGEKLLFETDFEWGAHAFRRTYRSLNSYPHPSQLGEQWSHTWQERLQIPAGSASSVHRFDDNNDRETFNLAAGSTVRYRPENIQGRFLEKRPDGTWFYKMSDSESHVYDGVGRLIAIDNQANPVSSLSFTYDTRSRLETVRDASGRLLRLVYFGGSYEDPDNAEGWRNYRLLEIQNSMGQTVVSYSYDALENLQTAQYSGGTGRVYHYGEASNVCVGATSGCTAEYFSRTLTGVTAESGLRLSNYYYDINGRVVRSVHADQANDTYLTYLSETQTRVSKAGQGSIDYTFQNDQYRKPLLVEADDGTAVSQYDAGGTWERHTDKRGISTKLEFNGYGLPIRTVHAEGLPEQRTTVTDWSSSSLQKMYVETLNASDIPIRKVSYAYNSRDQVVSTTDADVIIGNNRIVTRTYCEQSDIAAGICPLLGLVKSVDDPRTDVSDTTAYTYRMSDEATCTTSPATCPYRKGDLWKVTNALGQVIETLKYDGAGRVLSIKNSDGVITDFGYHPRGWLTARKMRGTNNSIETDDQITRIEYWPTGLVKQVTQPDGSFTAYTYDAAHRLTDIFDGDGNRIHYTLDNAGNRKQEDTTDEQGVLLRTLSRVYNQLGQLQTQKDANQQPTGFTYDANGNTDTITDALNRVTDHDYDPLNRLQRTLQDVGGIEAETTFKYDAQDNLTKVTDPKGLDTDYTYNAFGDLLTLSSPDTGTTTYTYDSAGNRKTQTDARNKTTTYAYDALNRLTGITYATSALNTIYTYDAVQSGCDSGETFSKGRLARMQDSTGSTQYCYDRFGNLTAKLQLTNGKKLDTRYAYTLGGQLRSITYPDGAVVDYVRNAQGQVTEVGAKPVGGTRQVLLREATYYPFGPVAEWVYGNGRLMRRSLNQNYQPGFVEDPSAGGISIGYEFDNVGNLAKLRSANQTNPPQRLFGYDDLNRLTEVKDGSTQNLLQGYDYDATGNRLSATAGGTTAYTYPATSHRLSAVSGTARSYDNAGNTTAIGGTARQFVYSDAGRLAQVKQAGVAKMNYAYNGRGEQVARYLGSAYTYTVYDEAGRWLGDYDTSGVAKQQAIWLNDLPVGLLVGSGASQKLHYVQPDALGTPRVVIDPSASRDVAVWKWELTGEAFGNSAPNQDPDNDGNAFVFDMRFAGQRYDVASGLSQNGFRDYEAATGRYPQSDPVGLAGGISTYTYVFSSPLMWNDPKGLAGAGTLAPPATTPLPIVQVPPWVGGLARALGRVGPAGALVPSPMGYPECEGPGVNFVECINRKYPRPAPPIAQPRTDAVCPPDEPDCNEHFSQCLGTSLADAVGGNYGSRRCSLCKESCIRNNGKWPEYSHTGDRCDYWNFR